MLFAGLASVTSQQRARRGQERAQTQLQLTRHRTSGRRLPRALPCSDFYLRHPEKVGATANVLITDTDELLPWLLVARPVSRKEATDKGGCIMFHPALGKDETTPREPLYFCITDTDDEVYGRAAYLPRFTDAPTTVEKRVSAVSSAVDSAQDSCREEGEDATPREIFEEYTLHNSCRCVSKPEPEKRKRIFTK